MKESILSILDTALYSGLISCLLLFGIFLLFLTARGKRKRGLATLRSKRAQHQADQAAALQGPAENLWIPAFHALLLALAGALFVFLITAFTPLPFLENFATSADWKRTPLRITEISQERDQTTFRLEAEVWNQSEEPIGELTAVIQILENEQTIVDQVSVPVLPRPLEPKTGGRFQLEYESASPLLTGYRIFFEGPNHTPVQHVTGFDVP